MVSLASREFRKLRESLLSYFHKVSPNTTKKNILRLVRVTSRFSVVALRMKSVHSTRMLMELSEAIELEKGRVVRRILKTYERKYTIPRSEEYKARQSNFEGLRKGEGFSLPSSGVSSSGFREPKT